MTSNNLLSMSREGIAHAKAGTIKQADGIASVPAAHYVDPSRWQQELDLIFKRLPLMLACSAELPEAGDYKALDVMGLPVLICRDNSGQIRAYENSCAHRGAQLVAEGRGHSTRITCPYHAWNYDLEGNLRHIFSANDFGDLDKKCYGLIELRSLEVSGLIWVLRDAHSSLDIQQFLCGYEQQLANFNFADWTYFDSRKVPGPNWKIAYDGYLDFYHLPILHRDTFGADTSNKALYFPWGPHQRVISPQTTEQNLGALPEDQWPIGYLLSGVWTVFPHISIASFDEGGVRGVLISQLFPGASPGESITVQNYLLEHKPDEAQRAHAEQQFAFLKNVVANEDYATGIKQQKNLLEGSRKEVLFGRNEEGGQRFHRWVQRVLDTPDQQLASLFGPTPA